MIRPVAILIMLTVPGFAAAQCVDYGDLATEPELAVFDLLPEGEIADIAFVGEIGWMARSVYGAMVAVDFSDPDQPVTRGVEPVTVMNETYDIDVSGDLGFLTYLQWGSEIGVRIFDISDPDDPVDIGDFQAPGGRWASYLAAAGDLVYVSFSYTLFGVLDVSDPTAPVLVGEVAIDHPWRIVLDGDIAYVMTDADPVIVAIGDPTAPTIIGTIPTADDGEDLRLVGNLGHVVTHSGLEIFDLTDPRDPVPLGSVSVPGTGIGIAVAEGVTYVSTRDAGIQVIDVRDPAAPVIHAVAEVPGLSWRMDEYADRLMVNSTSVLYIAPAQCPLGVTAVGSVPLVVDFSLDIYPNPFNPRTVIVFELPGPAAVTLTIHDLAGREVRTLLAGEVLPGGPVRRTWQGRDDAGRSVPSGVYLCRLRAGAHRASRTVTLVQ